MFTRVLVAVLLAITINVSAVAKDEPSQLVKFVVKSESIKGPPGTTGFDYRKKCYLALPIETRKSLEGYMVTKLGLSAIGEISLVAVYQQDVSGKRQTDSQLFHFIQTENYVGGTLLWSILFDSKDGSVRILYKANRKTPADFQIQNKKK